LVLFSVVCFVPEKDLCRQDKEKKKKQTKKFNVQRRIRERSDQSWHGIRNLGQSKLSINDT